MDAPATSTVIHRANVTQIPQAIAAHSEEIADVNASKQAAKDRSANEGGMEAAPPITGHPDFGIWTVQEIQLCQMGGKDPHTGAYISVGSIQLVD